MKTSLKKVLGTAVLLVFGIAGSAVASPLDYGFISLRNTDNLSEEDLIFAFSHRFNINESFPGGGAYPTFNLAKKFGNFNAAVNYGTKSPMDLELKLGWNILAESESKGVPLSAGISAGYSLVNNNILGEAYIMKRLWRFGLGAFFRAMSNAYNTSEDKWGANDPTKGKVGANSYLLAPGAGLTFEIIPNSINLVGEASFPLISGDAKYMPAWGAGLQWWIPDSPHVMSLNVSNYAGPNTIQGSASSGQGIYRNVLKVSYEWSTAIKLPEMGEKPAEPDPFGDDKEETKVDNPEQKEEK